MVGEIRDRETAEISMRAALTGHFVLSTLHTNDAPSAITRLTEMGVEPFVVASAVTAVLAQRLARRLCEHCREPYQPTADELEKLGLDATDGPALAAGLVRPLHPRLPRPRRHLPVAADDRRGAPARRARRDGAGDRGRGARRPGMRSSGRTASPR